MQLFLKVFANSLKINENNFTPPVFASRFTPFEMLINVKLKKDLQKCLQFKNFVYFCAIKQHTLTPHAMTTQQVFEKQAYNPKFDHTTPIVSKFNELGYSNIRVQTSLANGLSHYVYLSVKVLDKDKIYTDMWVMDDKVNLTIRISDHLSGLEMHCGGVSGNKMTMAAFQRLIKTGAIEGFN